MEPLALIRAASSAASVILGTSQDLTNLSKIFNGSKHQSALEKARRYYAVVEELAAQAVDGPISNEGEVPRYLNKSAYEERVHAWKDYKESFNELLHIIKPRSKSKTKRVLRAYIVAVQWHKVEELVKIMDENKRTLENAVQSDLARLQFEQNRAIQQYLISMSQNATHHEEKELLRSDFEDWKRPVPMKATSVIITDTISPTEASYEIPKPPINPVYRHESIESNQRKEEEGLPLPNAVTKCAGNNSGGHIPDDSVILEPALSVPEVAQHTVDLSTGITSTVVGKAVSTAKDTTSTAAAVVSAEVVKVGLIGTLAVGGATALAKVCDTVTTAHIGYRNADTAKQVATTGDQNAKTARLVADTGVQNALTAKEAADAAILTAKITEEKWIYERQKDVVGSTSAKTQPRPGEPDGTGSGEEDDKGNDVSRGSEALSTNTSAIRKIRSKAVQQQKSTTITRFSSSNTLSTVRRQMLQKQLDDVERMRRRMRMQERSTAALPRKNTPHLALGKERERELDRNLQALRARSYAFSSSPRPQHRKSEPLCGPSTKASGRTSTGKSDISAADDPASHDKDVSDDSSISSHSDWAAHFDKEEAALTSIPLNNLDRSSQYPPVSAADFAAQPNSFDHIDEHGSTDNEQMNSLDPKPNSDLLSANEMTAKSKKDEED